MNCGYKTTAGTEASQICWQTMRPPFAKMFRPVEAMVKRCVHRPISPQTSSHTLTWKATSLTWETVCCSLTMTLPISQSGRDEWNWIICNGVLNTDTINIQTSKYTTDHCRYFIRSASDVSGQRFIVKRLKHCCITYLTFDIWCYAKKEWDIEA